ncbi:MAG: hypothetical protein ACPG5B_00225 [Chitinophagales bacterium]
MKLYFNPSELPSQTDLDTILTDLYIQVDKLKKIKIELSLEERFRSRTMGSRRLAYAHLANRKGKQYESVMPRMFMANDFDAVLKHHEKLEAIFDVIKEASEILNDTAMAAGIDAMTYTKFVHDSLRALNNMNPAYDNSLAELDEFNRKVTQQDETEDTTTEEKGNITKED